ncbi:tRNA (adenosine(37)-N6)-threonylcarbamoyltransferase complex dimerization subunit type 1 TsaB [Leeia sp. TBRC 13508]|uniref:tRNA (Adenosine(37)-N6)-threonylcarbamoyltransferase complex dimerization subunit type 1 TsaB n=1 Tax=Leeia speluncae TaxID=2884804 RepID=A0ABS8D3B0_9NEIS|nr:tRNA (adenosine(37)-N6)-threonylcarbamoyltransferase complex dimerization subunit type 1 TsaB [Leeia speluncae]MCB6182486.1 tRNA (adenosine(37)-N6)-threonylcarbamoyltransferase complex dimerization subunit type 1 TsaB [Leeia speluncae]
MKILAIDTSTEQLSLALWLDGNIVERTEPPGEQHSSLILPMIQELMASAAVDPAELDGVAYPVGPGAFTGLRVGCGIAQGLGFALNIPLLGISTLKAMAAAVETDGEILVCLDARMGQVYTGLYQLENATLSNLEADRLANPEEISPPKAGVHLVGNGFFAYQDKFQPQLLSTSTLIQTHQLPHARAFAKIAAKDLEAGLVTDAKESGLVYLRDKVALTTKEREAK